MTQHLSEADVRGIAEYTRIGLDAEEVVAMTADLNAMIDSLAPMRDDEVRGSFTQEVALENAPKQEDGSFLIPSILGEGGDR